MLNYPCQVKEDVKRWIRDYFEENGKGCFAVIGISGGKDSSVAAALCAEALGKERVIGVLMPNGIQSDIEDAKRLVEFLEIPHLIINIGTTSAALCRELEHDQVLKINERLNNVIDGDQTGISKDVNWQGGGSFVYAELMEKNMDYLKDLEKATTIDELSSVYQRMKQGADYDFRVDLNRYENDPERKTMSFEDQKKLLIKMLNKNQLYFNEDNIDDADVRDLISDSDYQFNKSFYGKGNA